MASVRTRSESLNVSVATRLGLTGLSESKVIPLNVQGGPSHSQTLPHHCLQYLGQTPSEGKGRVTEAFWRADVRSESASKVILDERLEIMACTWTMNWGVQPELKPIAVSEICSLLTLGPSFIANFPTASERAETSCFSPTWQPKDQIQQLINSVKFLFAVLKSSSKVLVARCCFLLLLFCLFTKIITQVEDLSQRGKQASTPNHKENNEWCNSWARNWKRQCLYNEPGPALFMQV